MVVTMASAEEQARVVLEEHREAEIARLWEIVRALEVQVARMAAAEAERRAQWAEIKPKLDALLVQQQQFSGAMRAFRVLVWLVAPAVALWQIIAGNGGHK